MAWIVHTKVFINPYFSLSFFSKGDHLVSDWVRNDNFADIVVSSQSIVKNNERILFVKSWEWVENVWNSLSQHQSMILRSTESESWRGEVGTKNLNPVSRTSSFEVKFDFVIKISLWFDSKMIKVGLLSSGASHDLIDSLSLDFFPIFKVEIKLFCLWVSTSHNILCWYFILIFYQWYDFICYLYWFYFQISIELFFIHFYPIK